MGRISAKGLMWSASRINHVPRGPGVVAIFNEEKKTFSVHAAEKMTDTLRAEWWKRNFWRFSWFVTDPIEYYLELKTELESMSYKEMEDFKGEDD